MSIVLDANVVVASMTSHPSQAAATSWLDHWHARAEDLHAPQLFTYEVASAFAALEWERQVGAGATALAWRLVDSLDLTLHPPPDGRELVAIARRLRRRSAYDAAYIEVAMQLGAELWTLDGRLARNAESIGYPVQLMV